jgi:hypothetical protein
MWWLCQWSTMKEVTLRHMSDKGKWCIHPCFDEIRWFRGGAWAYIVGHGAMCLSTKNIDPLTRVRFFCIKSLSAANIGIETHFLLAPIPISPLHYGVLLPLYYIFIPHSECCCSTRNRPHASPGRVPLKSGATGPRIVSSHQPATHKV